MKHTKLLLLTAAPFLGVAIRCAASTVSLEFSTLPSAQGWTYFALGNSAPETSIFSVGGLQLSQNTIGVGLPPSGGNRYELSGVVDPLLPFTVDMRARVTQSETSVANNHFGFAASIFTGSLIYYVGIDASAVGVSNEGGDVTVPTSKITTDFHDYQIQADGSGSFSLYIDGDLEFTATARSVPGANKIVLGDSTGGQNSAADVTYFAFTQVPEPSVALLMLASISLILTRRKCIHALRRL